MPVIIFSRPIRTGKTTELLAWCRHLENLQGIAMPDTPEGRKIQDLSSGELFDAQCTATTEEKLIHIGPFSFYASAFERANQLLINAAAGMPDYLVIDEVGKLELLGQGFYPAVKSALEQYKRVDHPAKKLLLVVREPLLQQVCDFFAIKNPVIVHALQDIH